MVPVKKLLLLFVISKFVGYIVSSRSSSLLVNAIGPESPKTTEEPGKILRKQCNGNCECARYSQYDVPRDITVKQSEGNIESAKDAQYDVPRKITGNQSKGNIESDRYPEYDIPRKITKKQSKGNSKSDRYSLYDVPRDITGKQCNGNCECARYSQYDVPKSLKGIDLLEKKPSIPLVRRPLPKIPEEPPSKPAINGHEQDLVEKHIYDTIKPTNDKSTFNTHPTNGHFYTSFGRPDEQDAYKVNVDDEHIYEEIGQGDVTKDHTPSGYSEHIDTEQYQVTVPQKTQYEKFKENASKKLSSFNKSAKNALLSQSEKPEDSADKTNKGVSDTSSKLTKKSLGSKQVPKKSPSVTMDELNEASKELLKEADILASKLNDDSSPKHYGFNKYSSNPVKGSKDKVKDLKKTGSDLSDVVKDLSGDAEKVRKESKATLQGAKDKIRGGFDKIKTNIKQSAFKGSYSVKDHTSEQIGDVGNFISKPTI